MTDKETDIPGRDEAIIAQAMVMAAAHWDSYSTPQSMLSVAWAVPLALYIAIKYLQSLPEEKRKRSDEDEMKAILLARFPDFVTEVLAADPTPADLVIFKH